MARSEADALTIAWDALRGTAVGEGWRTIPVFRSERFAVLAGRHHPGDLEALVLGFPSSVALPGSALPEGHGFEVQRLATTALEPGRAWLVVSRTVSGYREFFTAMAVDLWQQLAHPDIDRGPEQRAVHVVIQRIRAWQDFMERGRPGVLPASAELGLVGELVVLAALLAAGVDPSRLVRGWEGPVSGLHDFVIGPGAIEVKATLSTDCFPAEIESLEQLDPGIRNPLFIAGVRLRTSEGGRRLPEWVDVLRARLPAGSPAVDEFEVLLLRAGYLNAMADRYVRRLEEVSTTVLRVDAAFPKIVRNGLPAGILRARYVLDLDSAGPAAVSLAQATLELEGT